MRTLSKSTITCVLPFSVFLACSGGGDGGPTGPSDRNPPAQPNSSLIQIQFASGVATITGLPGAVEGSTVVRGENQTTHTTSDVTANANGSFVLGVEGGFGDRILVVAVDQAGNASSSLELSIGILPVGGFEHIPFVGGRATLNLLYATGAEEHTVILQSSATIPGIVTTTFATGIRPQLGRIARSSEPQPTDPQAVGERKRHDLVTAFLRTHTKPALAKLNSAALQGAPTLGETELFWGANALGNATLNPAILEFIGPHTLVYVDSRIPQDLLSTAAVQALGDRFDPAIYERDRLLFGNETDVDGNGRIKILFTPSVNYDGEGTLGFFFPPDLLPRFLYPSSNEAEIFYMLAPDPAGIFGWATPSVEILLNEIVPSTLAHEFQHMISSGHRLATGLPLRDRWLDEAWSHVAEWLNGFRATDEIRTAAFVNVPEASPLIGDQETNGERGASFLFAMYLVDRFGQAILARSIEEAATGTDNITAVTGEPWADVFDDWSLALVLDGRTTDSVHNFGNLDPREIFERLKAQNPQIFTHPYLNSIVVDATELSGTARQATSTPSYVTVRSAEARRIADVVLTSSSSVGLRIGIVRTR